MVNFKKQYLYRMIHIENISHVLEYGITHRNSTNANRYFIPIGDSSIITTRAGKALKNGKILGDYIPFYFGYRFPMLYVIQWGHNGVKQTLAEDIVYCVTTVEEIVNSNIPFIFTDGHAIDSFSTQFTKDRINEIEHLLDWDAIQDMYWHDENDLDKKRRKEAEFLLENDLPTNHILGYICYNEKAKSKLVHFGIEEKKIVVRPNYYFSV